MHGLFLLAKLARAKVVLIIYIYIDILLRICMHIYAYLCIPRLTFGKLNTVLVPHSSFDFVTNSVQVSHP